MNNPVRKQINSKREKHHEEHEAASVTEIEGGDATQSAVHGARQKHAM